MFRNLVRKEVLSHLLEFRYSLYFVVTCLLVIGSFYVSMQVYEVKYNHHQELAGVFKPNPTIQADYPVLDYYHMVYIGPGFSIPPQKMEVFCQGLDTYLTKLVSVCINRFDSFLPIVRREEQDNPLPDLLPHLDLCFIVSFILSLFVFILSHNAITREREQGTLKLLFANPVERAKVILAKCLGGYLGVVFPLFFSLLVCLLISLLYPWFMFTGADILVIGIIFLYSLLYLLVLYFLGIVVSIYCRKSQASMAILVLVWLLFVVVIHNAGMLVIQRGTAKTFIERVVEDHRDAILEVKKEMDKRDAELREKAKAQKKKPEPEAEKRLVLDHFDDITDLNLKTMKDYITGLEKQYRRLKRLRVISPTLLYQSVVSDITCTGMHERIRLLKSSTRYQDWIRKYGKDRINEQYRAHGTHWVTHEDLPFDDLATFDYKKESLAQRVKASLVSVLVLACFAVLFFVLSFYAFIRTDID